MAIHTFGSYFGLAVTWFLTSQDTRGHKDNTSSYVSNIFSLAGTAFLWIMFPSFNAARAVTNVSQVRAVVNTFLAMTASVLASFICSRFLSEDKFDIVHIQSSTLTGVRQKVGKTLTFEGNFNGSCSSLEFATCGIDWHWLHCRTL